MRIQRKYNYIYKVDYIHIIYTKSYHAPENMEIIKCCFETGPCHSKSLNVSVQDLLGNKEVPNLLPHSLFESIPGEVWLGYPSPGVGVGGGKG